ncbi:MAG: hypothetical protein L6R28_04225 [Planctomycetes bacterium]|nr:hypothetical protein [Planctomycetota bacterium]
MRTPEVFKYGSRTVYVKLNNEAQADHILRERHGCATRVNREAVAPGAKEQIRGA